MATSIKVPEMGESISEGTVTDWRVKEGDTVASGAVLCELETDKVTQEIYAPAAGVISKIQAAAGQTVRVGEVLAILEEGAGNGRGAASGASAASPAPASVAPQSAPPAVASSAGAVGTPSAQAGSSAGRPPMPAAQRLMSESGIPAGTVGGTGKGGQVLKEDVVRHLEKGPAATASAAPPPAVRRTGGSSGERERVVPMSRLRQRIAERLVEAQQTAAILTTFNEVDMGNLMEMRSRYKDAFKEKHEVGLGFMSFFVRACIEALRAYPAINAEIRGTDIIYKNYFDVGVAVGGPKGLVVPIIRDADQLSFAGIESEIMRLALKVKDGSIALSELEGGTFTISNGGIYGSMLSTPILNPPQSGILGMHNIVKRPVVVNDQIVIRPVMYLALSYDHRIVDGKEAVSFLVRVKECIESPERMLLEV